MIFKEISELNAIITDISKAGNNIDEIAKLTNGLTSAQSSLVMTEAGLSEALIQRVNAMNSATAATITNTAATQAETLSDEDWLLTQWLCIGAEETDTAVTITNNAAKKSGITIVDALGLKYKNLAASIGISTTALTGFTIALVAIGAGIAVFNHFNETAEEVSEKVAKLKDEFQSALDAAESNVKTLDGVKDRYVELSKGVNQLGENISLTTEEYQEYNSIVNKIADMSPELIQGWTNEGNAIINLKGNIDDLAASYDEARIAAYNLLIASGENGDGNDIIQQWKYLSEDNILDKDIFGSNAFNETAKRDLAKIVSENNNNVDDFISSLNDFLEQNDYASNEITSFLRDEMDMPISYGMGGFNSFFDGKELTSEELAIVKSKANAVAKTYQAEINSSLHDVKQLANAYMMVDDIYSGLDDSTKNMASVIVNNINEEIADGFDDQTDVGEYVLNILESLRDATPEISNAFNEVFTNVELTPTEKLNYIKQIQDHFGEDTPISISLQPQIEEIDKLKMQYDNAISKFDKDGQSVLEKFFKDNSINDNDEIIYWNNVTEGAKSAAEAVEMYNNAKDATTPDQTSILSLDEAKIKVEGSDGEDGTLGIKDELELVQQVLADTKNVGIDTYQSLIGASNKYSSALKVEAGRVVVDNKRLQQVAKSRAKNTKLEVKEASTLKKLQWIQEARRLQQYNFQQNDLTVGIWETCDALMMEINQFDILTQGIDSATNAFTEFQNAQNMADTGDHFDVGLDMADAYQKALETGKIGTEEFMATMKGFMSAETFANIINLGDTQAQMDALDKFYDDFVSKYFIKGEDQEYDVSGIQNFMKDVAAVVDEEGNHIFATYEDGIFSLVDGMDFESLADHFGANVDMIYALFGELEEYSIGDSFTFTDTNAIDGYYQRLSELTKAQEQYNQAVESGSEYDQILAKKQLQEATERYNDSLDVNIKKFNDIYQTWLQTQDKGTFSDYLSQNMSEGEMLTSYYSLSDKIKEVKKEASLLQKTLVNVPKGSEAYEKYNEQLSALNGELEELNKSKATLEEQDVITEALSKNTKDLKDKTQQYLDCIEILNNKDKKYGQEEIEKAKVGVTDFISLLGNIPEEIRTQLEVEAETAKAKLQTVQSEIAQIQGNINRTGQTNTSAMMAAQSALNAKQSQASGLEAEIQQIETVLNMDTSAAEAQLSAFNSMEATPKETTITANDQATPKINAVNALKINDKEFNIKANFKMPSFDFGGDGDSGSSGGSQANGSAHALGTAYSTGDWRVGKTQGKSLIGELGTETLVRNGHYYTIGENGAELIDLQPNDIIFNHKQTEQLFKNGHISSRGKMIGNSYAEGSAFNYYGSGSINFAKKSKYDKRVYNSTRGHDVDDGAGDVADAFEELFDWIEIRIERLARVAEKWASRAETAISNSFFNKYYEKESKAILAQMNANSEAMDYYIATANAVGLNEKYADKVRKGAIDIETITDEELKEKIDLFQQWYEKALSCSDSFEELATALYNIPLDKATSKIEKFNEAIDLLEKKLDNAIGSTAKNKLVEQETKNQKKILEANKTALKESKKNLKSAGKSMTSASVLKSSDISKKEKKAIKNAVKNGKEINLGYFTEGSKAYKAALKYNEALKANAQAQYDLNIATEEYNRWLVEASKIKFDNVADDYEKKIQLLEHQMASYDRSIKEAEATANKINRQYYEAQKGVVTKELADYQAELKALEESFKGIKKGTDEWYDAKDAIEEVKKAISDCVIQTAELNNAINQLYFDAHANLKSDIDRIIAEQNLLTELFSHEANADSDIGNLTDAGLANLGSKTANYELTKSKAEQTKQIVMELQDMVNKGVLSNGKYTFNSLDDLKNNLKEFYTEWQNDIAETYQAQAAVVDLMKEKYQAELEMVQQLISDKKEALQVEKDLYSYQKSIKEKTTNINTLQRQLIAYSGDTSEEGMAKRQQVATKLNEAKEDLKETEYEKYLSDQESMLNNLATEYEELITKKLDDFQGLFQEGVGLANENISHTKDYLSSIATEAGYTQETKDLFNGVSGSITTNCNNIVAKLDAIHQVLNKDIAPAQTGQSGGGKGDTVGDTSDAKPKDYSQYVKKIGETTTQTKNTKDELEAVKVQLSQSGLSKKKKESLTTKKKDLESKLNDYENKLRHEQYELANKYINDNLSIATKGKSEYSDVNKKLYAKFGGKVLSSAELKELASILGITYNNAKKTGNLYKLLKEINFPGFSRGGTVVSVGAINKRIKENGDDALASVKVGESILTPVDSKNLASMVEMFSGINLNSDMIHQLNRLPDALNNVSNLQKTNTIDYGGVSFNFELANVTNADEFIATIQNSKKVQKALQSVTVDRMNGGGRLSVRSVK